ncbi:MAG: ABC transporter substrate-binding protein/permease [Gemmatimonadetes bacterium]|nr:ABC transporter substrate-binding protein/permease [Gemmatimonadota bacterium]
MALLAACAAPPAAESPVTAAPPLRWGGDAEGGAPFVEADPANPTQVRGFDVEIAEAMAKGLGRQAQFTQVAWGAIEASVARGDVDVGMSGLEDRPALRARFAVSLPYFAFREVLAVRPADRARFTTLASLAGRRVGTLGNTLAYTLLLEAQRQHGVVPVSYDDDVHPYTDLVDGRLDAVLLDHVIAERAVRRTGGFVVLPDAVGTGRYVAVFAARDRALRDSVDAVLRARMTDGTLADIYTRWGVMDSAQGAFLRAMVDSLGGTTAGAAAGASVSPAASTPAASPAHSGSARGATDALRAYLPALLRGALLTLAVSVAAMLLAVLLGSAIAAGRVYGAPPLRGALTLYVEVVRGTPVLLQLFVLYYGLSGVVRLPALAAAILGLGLNYAAYESEIYRSSLLAIPRAQLEAARTLGLSEWQLFRLVRAPQAFRLALAPMTNDFVALLKDSSLVSVITVVELTKQTAIYATNVGSWLVPGLLCAALYLALSLPLARMARRLEGRWSH